MGHTLCGHTHTLCVCVSLSLSLSLSLCVSVCVRERHTETKRERYPREQPPTPGSHDSGPVTRQLFFLSLSVCVCVCVCVSHPPIKSFRLGFFFLIHLLLSTPPPPPPPPSLLECPSARKQNLDFPLQRRTPSTRARCQKVSA